MAQAHVCSNIQGRTGVPPKELYAGNLGLKVGILADDDLIPK